MMCVTSLSVFTVFLALLSQSFGSPVAHAHQGDTGALPVRDVHPEPGFHAVHHHVNAMWRDEMELVAGSGLGMLAV